MYNSNASPSLFPCQKLGDPSAVNLRSSSDLASVSLVLLFHSLFGIFLFNLLDPSIRLGYNRPHRVTENIACSLVDTEFERQVDDSLRILLIDLSPVIAVILVREFFPESAGWG